MFRSGGVFLAKIIDIGRTAAAAAAATAAQPLQPQPLQPQPLQPQPLQPQQRTAARRVWNRAWKQYCLWDFSHNFHLKPP